MKRANFLPAPHAFELNHACQALTEAFGYHVYLVGSALAQREYRDVDVRLILPDEEFDALFPGFGNTNPTVNAKWSLLSVAISLWLEKRSGLPIDFQIQRQSVANMEEPHGRRHALGLFVQPKEPTPPADNG